MYFLSVLQIALNFLVFLFVDICFFPLDWKRWNRAAEQEKKYVMNFLSLSHLLELNQRKKFSVGWKLNNKCFFFSFSHGGFALNDSI